MELFIYTFISHHHKYVQKRLSYRIQINNRLSVYTPNYHNGLIKPCDHKVHTSPRFIKVTKQGKKKRTCECGTYVPGSHLPPLLGSPDGEEANIYGKLKRTKRAAGPAGCATWLGAPGRLSLAEVTPSTARTTAQHLVPSLASDCATPSRFLEHRHRAEFHPHQFTLLIETQTYGIIIGIILLSVLINTSHLNKDTLNLKRPTLMSNNHSQIEIECPTVWTHHRWTGRQ